MSDVWQRWFENVWAEREDKVYRARFHDLGGGIHPASLLTYQRYQQQPAHPGWLHHGVFACPPNGNRTSWLYVTSGLSNPWNLDAPGKDPSGFSGLGFELVLQTPQPVEWGVQLLHNLMAYELLVAVGRYPGAALFEYGNRVPLLGSITPEFASAIQWLLVETPSHFEPSFDLPSGRVDFYLLVGATEAEVDFARQTSHDMLVELLRQKGAHPVTDVARASAR
ncbi:MAG TPA: suppressor of fused domain protein [Planctomycetota bacterium]|nr:suppressor of fused domain protein [Planctomycetota bacterium]